jgi:hypothetical protein
MKNKKKGSQSVKLKVKVQKKDFVKSVKVTGDTNNSIIA